MNGILSFKMLFSTSGSSGETISKRHPGVGWVASLSDTVQLNLVSPCCRGSHRASVRARENCLQARSTCQGTEGEGAKATRCPGGGSGAGLVSLTVVATAQSRGAATFRPAPSQADATRTGRRPPPLPRGGSPEFTVRQSVAISTGPRAYESVRLRGRRTSPEPPTARSCNVYAPDAAAAFAPPLPCARAAAFRARLVRHRGAPFASVAGSGVLGPAPWSSRDRRACVVFRVALAKTPKWVRLTVLRTARKASDKTVSTG